VKLRVSRRPDLPDALTDALHALQPLIPTPWSADEFIEQVALSRGRPIHLLTYPLSTGDPTGYWLHKDTADFIIVPDRANGARRDAIIGHEIAHIVLGHEPQPTTNLRGLSELVPNLSPDLVTLYLPRHGYNVEIERQAETLATHLITYIETRSRDPLSGAITEHDRISDRLR
jgi:hypothetical protein